MEEARIKYKENSILSLISFTVEFYESHYRILETFNM